MLKMSKKLLHLTRDGKPLRLGVHAKAAMPQIIAALQLEKEGGKSFLFLRSGI